MRANAPPIPTPCANPTVALTPGTDPALGRLRSPCLELAGKFFFVSFFASLEGVSPAPAQSLPRSPTHPPPPIPTAAARLSMRLRPPPRFLPPPTPLSRVFVPVCAQAQFCSRRGPRRPRRTASAAPRTPPPLEAGSPRTTSTLSPSSITHTPISQPSPSISNPTTPSPPPPRASRHPTPLTPGGTARAAVFGPSHGLVASLCLVSSKRSELFKSRVRSELKVKSPGHTPIKRNPGSGG